ncbi:MAG: AAA family ATPase [Deltaproteobacteria bacterium]|nr:AAA family ATPase [Deltaproteobacteria bacterium]
MILENLELINFGKFSKADFRFEPYLNLVLGPNEAGKSTLMEAIPSVFFGVRNKDRFQNWKTSGSCQVAAILRNSESRWRIERDILSDQVCLVEEDDKHNLLYRFEGKVPPLGRSSEKIEYADRLAQALGIVEEDIFRSSLFFGQGQLEISGENELGAKVKNLLSGSVEVDYEKVLSSLQEDYFAITRKNPWGRDKTNDRALEKVRQELDDLEKAWLESTEITRKVEELQVKVETLRADVEKDRKDVAQGHRYLQWAKSRLDLEEKERMLKEEFRRLQKEEQKIENLQGERKLLEQAIFDMAIPAEATEDLPRLIYELQELRARAKNAQKDIAAVYEKMPVAEKTPWTMLFFLCVSLVSVGAYLIHREPDWLVPLGLGAGLAISLLFLFVLKRNSVLSNERSLIKGQAEILEAGLEETRKSLLSLEGYLGELGLKHSEEELRYLKSALQKRAGFEDRLRAIDSAMAVLEKPRDLQELKAALIRELAVLDDKKRRVQTNDFLAEMVDFPEAEEKLATLEERLKTKEKELSEFEQQESSLAGQLGSLPDIEDRGHFLKEKGLFLNERKKVLQRAFDLLAESAEDFRRGYLDRFAAEVDQSLGHLLETEGRSLRVTDKLTFCFKERGNEEKPVNHFSQGTVDAAFFAIRLVLARLLFKGRQLPLFLDDPLVNFDSKRLSNTLQCLEDFSPGQQVILFSHDRRLLDLIDSRKWNIILIPG